MGDKPSVFGLMILNALQDKPIYQGTVTYAEVLKRKAAAKVAKASRKKNRKQQSCGPIFS